MSTNNQKKDKIYILQIVTKLKASPSPQGGVFLFLIILLILEDLEQQESLDLVQMILKNDDSSILEKEWEFYILILSVLLQKIRHLDSFKLNKLLENLKNIPVYLREINEDNTLNLDDLTSFLNKNSLTAYKKIQKESLQKMLVSNLDELSKISNHQKIEKEDLNKKKLKN